MKKRTRITVITRQTVVARAVRVHCPECGAEVPLVTPESAAGVLQTTPREIHGLLASGDLHVVAESKGVGLICGNSLSPTLPEPEGEASGLAEIPGEAGPTNQPNSEGERQ